MRMRNEFGIGFCFIFLILYLEAQRRKGTGELHHLAHLAALVDRRVALVGQELHAHALHVLRGVELLGRVSSYAGDRQVKRADAVELHLVAVGQLLGDAMRVNNLNARRE